jgi:hypothetical protein
MADKDALITDADAALYTAKRDGKNRTVQSAPANRERVRRRVRFSHGSVG